MHTHNFIIYNQNRDFYYLDYRLAIDMEIGLKRLEIIKSYFEGRSKDNVKVVMNARGFTYDREETHLTMSKLSREYFSKDFPNLKLAIINDKYESQVNLIEKWFTKKEPAISWLLY